MSIKKLETAIVFPNEKIQKIQVGFSQWPDLCVNRKTSSPSDRVHLVYFNKTERDVIYKSELEALVSSAPMVTRIWFPLNCFKHAWNASSKVILRYECSAMKSIFKFLPIFLIRILKPQNYFCFHFVSSVMCWESTMFCHKKRDRDMSMAEWTVTF